MFSLNLIWAPKRSVVLVTLAAVLSPSAWAGSVSAEFVLDGKPFKPTEVAAFRVRSPSDKSKFLTYVVLTTKPVDADKIGNSPDPVRSLQHGPAALGDYLSAWIETDGTIEVAAHVEGDVYTGEAYPVGSPGVPGELTGTCKVNTTKHVACKAKTKKPSKTRDDRTCTLDISFDTDVFAPAAGKP